MNIPWVSKKFKYWQDLRALDHRRTEQREHVQEAHKKYKREISDVAIASAMVDRGPNAFNAQLPRPKFDVGPYVPPFKNVVCSEEHVIAMDDMLAPFYGQKGSASVLQSGGFPGFPYLTELTQITEFRDLSDTHANEMTRKFIKLHSDGKHNRDDIIAGLEADLKRFHVKEWCNWAARFDGYMGRAQLFSDFGDNDEELQYPLLIQSQKIKKNSLKGFKGIEPITTYPADYNADNPLDPTYYVPESWFVYSKRVHASRLLTFIGHPVPDLLKPVYNFSGMSLSQLGQPYVDYFLTARDSVGRLMKNFSTSVFKTDMEGILAGQNYELFKKRLLYFTAVQNNQGVFMLDKDTEEFGKVDTPLGGLKELLAQAQEHMATVAKTPLSVMFGLSPSGLTTTAESDITIFNNHINTEQEFLLRGPLEAIIKILSLNRFGRIYDDVGFDFVDLVSMTEKERSQIRTANGATDVAYITAGVVTNTEVRQKVAGDPDSGFDMLNVAKPSGKLITATATSQTKQDSGSPTNTVPQENKEGEAKTAEQAAGLISAANGKDSALLASAVDMMIADAQRVAMDAGFNGNQHVGGISKDPSTAAMQHSSIAMRATNLAKKNGFPSSHARAMNAHQRAYQAHEKALANAPNQIASNVHRTYMDAHEAAIALHTMESAPQPEEAVL
jgi:hypothetical protein